MLRNVYINGDFGDKFVKEMQIYAESVADVIKCLEANFGINKVKKYLYDKHQEGVRYHIEACGVELDDGRELLMSLSEGDIIITPVPAGSDAVARTIAGIVLIVVGAITGQGWLVSIGLNLAASGIQELLAPDPSVDEEEESYLFDGDQQNIVNGDPVPLLYGRLRVQGQPVSFELKPGKVTYNNAQGMDISGVEGGGDGPAHFDDQNDGDQHLDTSLPYDSTDQGTDTTTTEVTQTGSIIRTTGAPGRQSGGKAVK